NYGAFVQRTKTGLRFDIENGTFGTTIHEWEAALRNGLFIPDKIHECFNFRNSRDFSEFIATYYTKRVQAKNKNDVARSLFYKLLLNSSYGKFAQNSEHFQDYALTAGDGDLRESGYAPVRFPASEIKQSIIADRDFILWGRPSKLKTSYNVATAASITGAARAVLMDGIAHAKNPVYCDTDSIICEGLDTKNIGDKKLGAWKLEAIGDEIYIAGRKMYALFNKGKKVKMASKGVRLSAAQIKAVAEGATIEYQRDAPSYSISGRYSFITRKVSKTGEARP
ncbi:MAG: DNA polymerase, partial [Acidobacteriaceae bacterium]